MRLLVAAASAATLAFALPVTAGAQLGPNLLTNGGFEQGAGLALEGWTTFASGSGYAGASGGPCGITDPASRCALLLLDEQGAANAYVQQQVTGLTIGTRYIASVFFQPFEAAQEERQLYVTGTGFSRAATLTGCASGDVCQLSLVFNAEVSDVTFSIASRRTAAPVGLSGATVADNAILAVHTTPEPGTWALLGTGLLTLGSIAARRRHAS